MKRILFVDDDREFRATQEEALKRANYEAVSVSNGKEALAMLEVADFDLLITDIIMPEMEGIELIREITKTRPALKVIAISGGGRGNPGDYLMIAQKLGVSEVLAKPYSREDLLSAVRNTLATAGN